MEKTIFVNKFQVSVNEQMTIIEFAEQNGKELNIIGRIAMATSDALELAKITNDCHANVMAQKQKLN